MGRIFFSIIALALMTLRGICMASWVRLALVLSTSINVFRGQRPDMTYAHCPARPSGYVRNILPRVAGWAIASLVILAAMAPAAWSATPGTAWGALTLSTV